MGFNYSKFIIDLRKILKKYRIDRLERPIHENDQLVLCVNQRMAYIYVLDRDLPLSVIIERLRNDARIDIISWKNGDYINVVSGIRPGSLRYNKGGEYTDIYEQTWSIEGKTDLLDLYITDKGKVFYGDYPDALARLYGALHSHPGRFIVVNAKLGCEFKAQSTPFHLGGSGHGSLHKQESLVPLVIAGTTATPKFPRLVDMKDFVLQLFRQQ
jgi:hypothetical protein